MSVRRPAPAVVLAMTLLLALASCTSDPTPTPPATSHTGSHSLSAAPTAREPHPGLTIDTTLPRPTQVKTYGDDRVITVTWQGVDTDGVVGYYVSYRAQGSGEWKAKQVQARRGRDGELPTAVQIQPVENGVQYEITVASVAGTYESFPNGRLDDHDEGGRRSTYARGNGRISTPVTAPAVAGSDARVAALRSRLTGFFDDFNSPAGPFDETKWNQATTACVLPGTAAAFINDQFHSHNMLRSECDRAGIVSRPRAVFDTTGATPQNPAVVAWDMDGISQPRDTWYLDLIPTTATATGLPLDVTSHNSLFDDDSEGPGSMLRINVSLGQLTIAHYDRQQKPTQLRVNTAQTVCPSDAPAPVRFDSCDMTTKVTGMSPLAELDLPPQPIANVRRHWMVSLDGTTLRVHLDSSLVAVAELPAAFLAIPTYTVHSTIFSYNTGKDYVYPQGAQVPGIGPPLSGVYPYISMLHWDNFGFSGPAPTEQISNYVEGGTSGTQPYFSDGGIGVSIPEGNRTTIVPIPDDLGAVSGGKARLYFTAQQRGYNSYQVAPGDHVLVNGHRYPVTAPQASSYLKRTPTNDAITPATFVVRVDAAHLVKGDNVVEFRLDGALGHAADTLNVHLEVPHPASAKVAYTPPATIFGEAFLATIHPAMTNCDQYVMIEQDLGLPYPDGRTNLTVGECQLMAAPHHAPK